MSLSKDNKPEDNQSSAAFAVARDSNWMFVSWNINDKEKENILKPCDEQTLKDAVQVIRIHDEDENKYNDLEIKSDAKSWYVNVDESGHKYHCEIGLSLPTVKFISLVKSNTVSLPQAKNSAVTDTQSERAETLNSLSERMQMLCTIYNDRKSKTTCGTEKQKKDLWLIADCEIVLYGATLPDAELTVGGKKVNINSDGAFNLRFSFPDGVTDIPVKASSGDKTQYKTLRIQAQKKTISE